jgi:V8-like Glu-specific endopeptidase
MNIKSRNVVFGMAAALWGCSEAYLEPLGELHEAEQCGPSLDFQDVELYNGSFGVSQSFVTLKQNPVGQLHRNNINGVPTEWCSGTLIARDLFLSAGHCDYAAGEAGLTIRFRHQLDGNGNPRTPVLHTVTQVIEQRLDATTDYAVVKISGAPGVSRGYARLSSDEPNIAGLLTLIGHPDVDAGADYKKVSTGQFDGTPSPSPNYFRHQADTLNHSSGSGVLRRDGLLLGVHVEPGCNTTPPIMGNEAVRMSALLRSSPVLQKIATMQGVSFARVDNSGGVDAIAVNFDAVYVRGSTGNGFGNSVNFTGGAYYGDRGTFFGDVTQDGRADAIALNNDRIVVRRSNGTSFTSNETWSQTPQFADRGTFVADVTGDFRADLIFVNNDRVVVRRSNGSSFGPSENWTNNAYYGEYGTHFADVTGDGRADAIAVANDRVVVRRSTGTSFSPNEDWTTGVYYGEFGTHFADVTGEGRADAIAVTANGVLVRPSTGTLFSAAVNWTGNAYHGEYGTHFADVTVDGRADAIVLKDDRIVVRRSTGTTFTANETWLSAVFRGAL